MKLPIKYSILADYFVALSNESQSLITNLKLQKLVYYSQAWHLAFLKTELISEDFEAWVHGPVLPVLYNDYRQFSWMAIVRPDLNSDTLTWTKDNLPAESIAVLNDVVFEYFGDDAYQLEKLTHSEAPWLNARKGLNPDQPSNNKISKIDMLTYYSQYIKS